jgi:hypothetical protein
VENGRAQFAVMQLLDQRQMPLLQEVKAVDPEGKLVGKEQQDLDTTQVECRTPLPTDLTVEVLAYSIASRS